MTNFISVVTSIAELADGGKLRTQSDNHSLSHSPSLFDAPGTEAFASKQSFHFKLLLQLMRTSLLAIVCLYLLQ